MPLLDKLKEKALDAINDEEKQAKWVDKGFDSAVKAARDLIPTADDEAEIKSLADAAEYGLKKLEKHKSALVGLGQHGLRSTISLLGLGQYDEAARHAALVELRTTASWLEVNKAILSTAAEGNQAKRDLDAKIEEVKDVLKDIGTTAAKAVLPFLLAVI